MNSEQKIQHFLLLYQRLLTELSVMAVNAREVTALINARQPLIKRKEPHQSC